MRGGTGRRPGASIAFAAAAAAALAAAALLPAPQDAHAYPYMSVSADDDTFGSTFAGSMVVEVAVRDPAIRDIGSPVGEPSVTVDGEPLRMAQGADGSWYAYFADIDAAMAADAAAAAAGAGMDFGVFCSSATDKAVLGASFAYADAVAVARPAAGGTNGGGDAGTPAECAHPIGGDLLNNVVRRAPSLSGASSAAPGQIGISPDVWPVVQLYSLGGTVKVEYRGSGGGTERAELVYDEIPNAAMHLDRGRYPAGAEVYVSITDAQLNQDPTDRDVWTFSTDPDAPAVFYMGGWDGKDAPPSVDLHPHLRSIGFKDNGALTIDAGRTVSFKPNGLQSATAIMGIGGDSYASLVTVRETGASTSEFASHDGDGASTVWVPRDAPRGTAAVFEYNDMRMSALTGPSTATIGIGTAPAAAAAGQGSGQQPPPLPLLPPQSPAPGALSTVVITDADRNTIPSKRDVLSASDAGPVPSVRMGEPLTIDGAGGVWWLWRHGGAPEKDGQGRLAPAAYSAVDSGRLAVAWPPSAATGPAALIIDAGYGGGDIRRLLGYGGDSSPAKSSLWLNYDVRSLAGPHGQDGATIGIVFGGQPPAGVASAAAYMGPPAEVWDASDGRGTMRVLGDHGDRRGPVAFVVSLPGGVAEAASTDKGGAVAHIDLFSFGVGGPGAGIGGKVVNNAVYRIEAEETGANTGVFDGTIEHVVLDGRNAADPALAASLVAYGDDVRIAASGGAGGGGAVTVSYMDVGAAGGTGSPVAAGIDAKAHAGSVYFDADSYGFGRPVTITLVDPDMDTDRARVETYGVVDDARSPHVDAVASGGSLLFEVDIGGERYRRCVVDGAEHGGLAASGFALVETGPDTGVFTGTFKLPPRICNADGTGLVSPAGGRIDARYYDYAGGGGGGGGGGRPSVVEASPRGDPRPAGGGGVGGGGSNAAGGGYTGGGGGGAEAADAGWDRPRTQIPDDARRIAMVKGEQMSDAELYRVVHSAAMAAGGGGGGGGGWDNPDPYGGGDKAVQPAAPSWYKTVAGWWGDGRIPDAEFAASARYVLDAGLVRPPG